MQGRQQIRGFKEKVGLGQMLNKIKGNEHEQKSVNLVRRDHRKSKSTISVEWEFVCSKVKGCKYRPLLGPLQQEEAEKQVCSQRLQLKEHQRPVDI